MHTQDEKQEQNSEKVVQGRDVRFLYIAQLVNPTFTNEEVSLLAIEKEAMSTEDMWKALMKIGRWKYPVGCMDNPVESHERPF